MKNKIIIALLGITIAVNLQAQDIGKNQKETHLSVEDINKSNYLYNLKAAVYKLMDKYEDNQKEIILLKKELKETKNQLTKTASLVTNLDNKLKIIENNKFSFEISPEDNLKIKNFLKNK